MKHDAGVIELIEAWDLSTGREGASLSMSLRCLIMEPKHLILRVSQVKPREGKGFPENHTARWWPQWGALGLGLLVQAVSPSPLTFCIHSAVFY